MKTNNNSLGKTVWVFVALFVVICCNVLYSKSIIDLLYMVVVLVYLIRYIYIRKKPMNDKRS